MAWADILVYIFAILLIYLCKKLLVTSSTKATQVQKNLEKTENNKNLNYFTFTTPVSTTASRIDTCNVTTCTKEKPFIKLFLKDRKKKPLVLADYDEVNNPNPHKIKIIKIEGPSELFPVISIGDPKQGEWNISCATTKIGKYIFKFSIEGREVEKTVTVTPSEIDFEHSSINGTIAGNDQHATMLVSVVPSEFSIILKDRFENLIEFDETKCHFELRKNSSQNLKENLNIFFDGRRREFSFSVQGTGIFEFLIFIEKKLFFKKKLLLVSQDDRNEIEAIAEKKSHWMEAVLVTDDGKTTGVWILITPQVILVKKKILKIFTTRMVSFSCKRSLNFKIYTKEIEIIQGGQDKILISFSDSRKPTIFYALYLHWLNARLGNSCENFQQKFARLKSQVPEPTSRHNVEVDRNKLLRHSVKLLKDLSKSHWFYQFKITFSGEMGIDLGGPSREFFELLNKALLFPSENVNLFRLTSDNHAIPTVHPNHLAKSAKELDLFEFAGKIVAKSVLNVLFDTNTHIPVRFSCSFYKMIIGEPIYFDDYEQFQPQTFKYLSDKNVSVEDIKSVLEDDEIMDIYPPAKDLVNSLTESTRIPFLHNWAKLKIETTVEAQVNRFKKGFHELIPEELICIFTNSELELLFCGVPTISVENMRQYVSRRGEISPQTLEWFWGCLSTLPQADLARLLHFITGSSQIPIGGFAAYDPPITIAASVSEVDSIPTAHTCFNELVLPRYSSYNKLLQAIYVALNYGSEGFAFS